MDDNKHSSSTQILQTVPDLYNTISRDDRLNEYLTIISNGWLIEEITKSVVDNDIEDLVASSRVRVRIFSYIYIFHLCLQIN